MASTTSDTGDASSKQQQAQRNKNYNKRKRPVSSVDHCHPYRMCVCVWGGGGGGDRFIVKTSSYLFIIVCFDDAFLNVNLWVRGTEGERKRTETQCPSFSRFFSLPLQVRWLTSWRWHSTALARLSSQENSSKSSQEQLLSNRFQLPNRHTYFYSCTFKIHVIFFSPTLYFRGLFTLSPAIFNFLMTLGYLLWYN